ncbi:MAG TPA: O-antigen ligase family protein, partial [Phycisphaerae bacterium]|nr:O-antigen ligase family protein [Phycisphaerae bacterium]
MTAAHLHGPARPGAVARWGEALMAAAFVVLLCLVAARPFLGEHLFRFSPLEGVLGAPVRAEDPPTPASRLELARATFAAGLMAAFALWALGAALSRRPIRRAWFGAVIVGFAAVALASALSADDRRSGLLVWAEQAAILLAAFVAAQLCADRRRWNLLVAVLAAVGIALAVKGLWQFFVEAPERLGDFRAYRAERLSAVGAAGDAPRAAMLQTRLADPAPFGYFGLTNTFASLLVVLLAAAAGLAADAIASAKRLRRTDPAGKGEVHLPTLAAGVAVCGTALAAAALVLTGSRAGIAAGILAAAGAVVVAVFRRRLVPHARKAAVAAAVFVLACAAVVAYRVRNDKSMIFRWFYWTASAEIVRDRPLLGVGGGNFGDAYLQHRRAEAEEAVKAPHNFVAHATAQFGLIGGGLYLAAVFGVLWGIVPKGPPAGPREAGETSAPASTTGPSVGRLAAVVAAVLLARLLFGGISWSFYLVLLDGLLPALVFAAALAASLWIAGVLPWRGPVAGGGARIALGCGAAGFVVHNLVEFSMWTPATALVFWTAAGGLLARAGGPRGRRLLQL